jgi:hypothetical protein
LNLLKFRNSRHLSYLLLRVIADIKPIEENMDLSRKPYKAFIERRDALRKQYSPKNAEKQHSKGKLTAHERISLLFDNGTFEEIDAFVTPADQPVEFGKVERCPGLYNYGWIAGNSPCKENCQDPGNGTQDGCPYYCID